MTGTEKILRHIAEQAEAESGKILEAARTEAGSITAAAEKEAAEIARQGEAKAEAFRKDAESRLEASLAMQKRRAALAVRGELVKEALANAYDRLKNLPAEEGSLPGFDVRKGEDGSVTLSVSLHPEEVQY